MRNGNHTPGPWEFWGNGASTYPITGPSAAACMAAESGILQCPVSGRAKFHQIAAQNMEAPALVFGDTPEIAKANARLIAAAPCLLEALIAMTERYCSLVNSGDAGNWNPEDEPQVQKARAAIAKATGEQP